MTELEQLIYDNPNNMKLGEKIREKYGHRATVNNSESTSVTSHDFPEIQLELNINRPEKEDDLDLNLAYTSARTTPYT